MSIHDLKKNAKPKLLQSSFDAASSNLSTATDNVFKFKHYSDRMNSSVAAVTNTKNGHKLNRSSVTNSFNRQSGIGNKFSSEKVLTNMVLSRTGKVQKQKPKNQRTSNTNLECFNLMEKEKFRQLLEQSENYRPLKIHQNYTPASSAYTKNVYKSFIHASPTVTKDDIVEVEKCPSLVPNAQARVSAGYSRRISLSLDIKPEGMLPGIKSHNNPSGVSYFNKYSSSGVLKVINSGAGRHVTKASSENGETIDVIDLSNNTIVKTKLAQKRPGMPIDENLETQSNIENFRKEKKDFFDKFSNGKLTRSLTEFEKSIDDRLKNNHSIIEAVLKKSQNKIDTALLLEEERYKMKKRARQEKDLIERELAQKFTQQLHVDSNKYTSKYLEEDLEVEEENEFPELTNEHNQLIDNALTISPQDEVLVNQFSISICRKDIQTLRGLNWLNDEIINFYMSLLCERSKDQTRSLPKVHAMTTFFYPKLLKDGYGMLRRWTRKIDIFSYDLVLVPLHLGLHWTLAVIDFNCREVRYYDSMNGNNGDCLKALKNYLNEEHKDKKGSPYDLSDWNFLHNKNLPQQMNGSDCGMFACKYAEYLSRGKTSFNFNQSHMPYFRRRMVWEIVNAKLMV